MSIDLAAKNLSFNDAVVAITTEYPFMSEADVRGFFACTDDERAMIIRTYKDAGRVPDPSGWDVLLKILTACADVANLVIPITGAIQGVYGVVKLGS